VKVTDTVASVARQPFAIEFPRRQRVRTEGLVARILLLLVIGFVIYLLFRGFFRAQVRDKDEPPQAGSGGVEDMVACAICGVNMPRSESKQEAGRITCRDPESCKHAG
jgi:uncharacterized protein